MKIQVFAQRARCCAALALLVCAVTGCMSLPPLTYLPDDKQRVQVVNLADIPAEKKATIEFSTNTLERATFLQKPMTEMCDGFDNIDWFSVARARDVSEDERRVHTALAIGTLGLSRISDPTYDKTPHRVVKEFEAEQDLIFHARTSVGSGPRAVCGPLRVKLRPEAGKRYRLDFVRDANLCRLDLEEVREGTPPVIPAHARWRCTPSLIGFDGNKVVGYQEFEKALVKSLDVRDTEGSTARKKSK